MILARSPETINVSCGVLVHPHDLALSDIDAIDVESPRLLMGRRISSRDWPLLWEFPGGKEDPGDLGPRSALVREWREELGLVVSVGERIATGIIDADVRVMIEMFEVRAENLDTDLDSIGMLDHEEIRWVTLDHAVRRLPCSPAFFVHYPFLDLWLRRRSRGSYCADRLTTGSGV